MIPNSRVHRRIAISANSTAAAPCSLRRWRSPWMFRIPSPPEPWVPDPREKARGAVGALSDNYGTPTQCG
ncbi:hypothetical protein GCM10027601_03340 [Nocardioides ungokensis]